MREMTSAMLARRSTDQASCRVDTDTVVMYLPTGACYSLDGVGSYIWDVLETPMTVSRLVDVLRERYDISAEDCLRDTLRFLDRLRQWRLIEVEPGTP